MEAAAFVLHGDPVDALDKDGLTDVGEVQDLNLTVTKRGSLPQQFLPNGVVADIRLLPGEDVIARIRSHTTEYRLDLGRFPPLAPTIGGEEEGADRFFVFD